MTPLYTNVNFPLFFTSERTRFYQENVGRGIPGATLAAPAPGLYALVVPTPGRLRHVMEYALSLTCTYQNKRVLTESCCLFYPPDTYQIQHHTILDTLATRARDKNTTASDKTQLKRSVML